MNNGATNPAASLSMLLINLNHYQLAQDLLVQNVGRMGLRVVMVNKPYTVGEARVWYTDHTGQVATNVNPDCPLAPNEIKKDDGFVVVEISGVVYLQLLLLTQLTN